MNRLLPIVVLTVAATAAAQGTVLDSFRLPTTPGVPVGLDNDGSGNLLFTSIGTIDEIGKADLTGLVLSSTTTLPNSTNPIGITTDGTNIYVTDTVDYDVDVYDLAYNYVSSFTVAAESTFPEGISFRGANAHLYVVDGDGTNFVHEYDLTGTLITSYPINGSSPDGIAWDPLRDEFYIYDSGTDFVRKYDTAFVELASFPGPNAAGFGLGEGLGFINGLVYVCVTSIETVVVFDAYGNAAFNQPYGAGCPTPQTGAFYELFTAASPFDLAGTAIHLQPNPQWGWQVNNAPGATFDPSFVNNLNMADDQLIAGLPLGFTINVPGVGARSTIDVDSNGRVGWDLPGYDYSESVPEFIAQKILAPFWDDLNPSAAGGVYFDQKGSYVLITYDSVPEYSATGANTAQLQIHASGDIFIVWQGCTLQDCLVGYSDGKNMDPGPLDLTAAMPFHTSLVDALELVVDVRPILGATMTFDTLFTPNGTVAGSVIAGLSQVSAPLDPAGMPGCTLLSSGDLTDLPWVGGTSGFPITVPNDPSLPGWSIYWQSVALAPSVNALGVVVSNGVQSRMGSY